MAAGGKKETAGTTKRPRPPEPSRCTGRQPAEGNGGGSPGMEGAQGQRGGGRGARGWGGGGGGRAGREGCHAYQSFDDEPGGGQPWRLEARQRQPPGPHDFFANNAINLKEAPLPPERELLHVDDHRFLAANFTNHRYASNRKHNSPSALFHHHPPQQNITKK